MQALVLRNRIKRVVEQPDTIAGKVFDAFIQALIVVSLVSFSLETLPDIGDDTRVILGILETVTVAIFTVEYVLRVLVADSILRFVFSFYGLIDLLAILPFYVARGMDLRSLRIFRLFRLARLFKIARYTSAVRRFKSAFTMIRAELAIFLVAAAFMLFVSSVGIYYFENSQQPEKFSSVISSLWWAVSTLTTVGYGDVYPITVGGKVFTSIILFVGLGIIAVPAGLIASALTKTLRDEDEEDD